MAEPIDEPQVFLPAVPMQDDHGGPGGGRVFRKKLDQPIYLGDAVT